MCAYGNAPAGRLTLAYDRLDRLQDVRDQNLALIEAYTYDATGNRLSHQLGNQPATSYTYPATSHRLDAVGSAARSYDAVGNTVSGIPGYETDSASYDARNRLVQVGTPSAQLLANYNGRGERVIASQGSPAAALPTTSAGWTSAAGVRGYVYDESGQVISMLIGGNPLRYEEIVWVVNILVGRVESSTSAVIAVHAIHSDHLNTPRALANAQTQGGQAAGTVVWRWKLNATSASGSNAFGTQAAEENPDGNSATVKFDLRFPGQQYDAATGVNYNYFRDYEPGTGRYVESDPIGLNGGLATYFYGKGSPFRFTDPFGLTPSDLFNCLLGPRPQSCFERHPIWEPEHPFPELPDRSPVLDICCDQKALDACLALALASGGPSCARCAVQLGRNRACINCVRGAVSIAGCFTLNCSTEHCKCPSK